MEATEDKGFSWSVVILAGLLLGVSAGFAYYLKTNPPCNCGEKAVDEVAQASAEVATNGKAPRAKKEAPESA